MQDDVSCTRAVVAGDERSRRERLAEIGPRAPGRRRATYPFGPSTSLCSTAYSAACVRDASPSLPRMLDT